MNYYEVKDRLETAASCVYAASNTLHDVEIEDDDVDCAAAQDAIERAYKAVNDAYAAMNIARSELWKSRQ